MGQVLLGVDAVIGTLLWVTIWVDRYTRRPRPWSLVATLIGVSLVLLLWAGGIGSFAYYDSRFAGGQRPLQGSLVAGGFVLLGIAVIVALGWRRIRRSKASAAGAAATWPRHVLTLALCAVVTHMGLTAWLLDRQIRRDLAKVCNEAAIIRGSLLSPDTPGTVNAAILYYQAQEQLAELDDPDEYPWTDVVLDWIDPLEGKCDPAGAELLAFLESRAPQLSVLREASLRPVCSFDIDDHVPMDWLSQPLGMGGLLSLSARVNAQRGRMGAAVDDLNACFALAAHLAMEPAMLGPMFSTYTEELALESFQSVLDTGRVGPEDCRRIRIGQGVGYRNAFSRSFYAENANGLDAYTCNAWLDDPIRFEWGAPFPPLVYRLFLWQDDLQGFQEFFWLLHLLMERPYHESRLQFDRWNLGRSAGLLAALFIYDYSEIDEMAAKADASRRVAVVGLEMLRFRDLNGEYPETVESLIAADAPVPIELLTDPFTGRYLKLGRTDSGRLVVYSVGEDIEDDGGAPPTDRLDKNADIVLILPK